MCVCLIFDIFSIIITFIVPEKKRRIETSLSDHIDNLRDIIEQRDKEIKKEKAQREIDKQKRDENKRRDKHKIHANKMAMQASMLKLLKSLVEKEKEN